MKQICRISANFTWAEFTRSRMAEASGIDNSIETNSATTAEVEQIRRNVRALVVNVLQPLRDAIGRPIQINSGYRCAALNRKVGGAANSQHTKGEAADIVTSAMSSAQIARLVRTMGLPFDQMIVYGSFLHISYREGGNRFRLLYDKSYNGERL